MKYAAICMALLLAICIPPAAQADLSVESAVRKIEGHFEPASAKAGQVVTFKVQVELNDGFHTYPTVQVDPEALSTVTKIVLPTSSEVIFVEPINNPPFQVKAEPPTILQLHYYPGGATWEIPAIVSPNATPGEKTIKLPKLEVILCDKSNCLPPKKFPISANLTVLDGAVEVEPRYKDLVDKAIAGISNPKKDDLAPPKKGAADSTNGAPTVASKQVVHRIAKGHDYAADMKAVEAMLPRVDTTNSGFVAFVLTAMFWGAVTLLTPCVFPMIPITVSFFLKQGEKKQHNPLTMALVYTLTIVAVLGVAALFFLAFFRKLSVDPWMNVALGALFVFFALSLFGMYDIVLPSFLVRFTSTRERSGGYGGVVFMALSFSIVSFTCVAPFLGGFAGMAASGKFSSLQLAAGAFAFAGTFAAPFFLLALFPTLLKKMPKSGSWMNTIKVVMGFLELAAALKFFRNAELRWTIPPEFFTYDFVLSLWVVILLLAGLYLLNLYRLPHDEPQEHIGAARMLFGLMSISLGLYLLPGLFSANGRDKQRPAGVVYAWVDAFLLPEPSAAEIIGGELAWSADLREAIEEARARDEVVFIDHTGVTCTNCKLNEKDIFPQAKVKNLLKKFRLVQLYTDTVPPEFYEEAPDLAQQNRDAQTNLDFQRNVFRTEQLPLYALLKPEPGPRGGRVRILGVYDEGKISNADKFVDFLKKGEVK